MEKFIVIAIVWRSFRVPTDEQDGNDDDYSNNNHNDDDDDDNDY